MTTDHFSPDPDEAGPLPSPEPIALNTPIDVRSISLAILAFLASIFAIHWASEVLIPVLFGLMLSYALSPIVDRLARWHIPRFLGATLLLASIVGGIGTTIYTLSDDASELIQTLPDAVQKLRQTLKAKHSEQDSAIDKVQEAATQLEQVAEENGAATPKASVGVTRVQIEQPRFKLSDYFWTSTLGLMGFIGQIVVALFISYFLLISGDRFRRKLVKIVGPTFSQKKITVQVLDQITTQIQYYLLVQIFTSFVVGVATWLALWSVGLEHAAVWGIVAGLLNFIPYIGMVLVMGGTALVGFLQFGSVHMALLIAGISLIIHTIEGNLLTPWLSSRASQMSPVVIFIGILVWGWLWGIWGLLLGVPILMSIKVVCDHVEDLKSIGELLGD